MDELRQMAERFTKNSKIALELIGNIRALLQQGIAPNGEMRTALHDTLEDVSASYRSVVKEAEAAGINDSERPVDWYVKAIDEARSTKKLDEALETIEAFLTIGSNLPKFDTELEEYRSSARNKARRILDKGINALEDGSLEAEETLLSAVRAEQLYDETGMALVDDVERLFSMMVGRGVMLRTYEEGRREVSLEGAKKEPATKTDLSKAGDILAQRTVEIDRGESIDQAGSEGTQSEGYGTKGTSSPQGTEVPQNNGDSRSSDAPKPPVSEDDVLNSMSPVKNVGKTIGAKAFRNSIYRMFEPSRFLFSVLTHVGAMRVADVASLARVCYEREKGWMTAGGIDSAAAPLVREGLACAFTLNGEIVACLTSLGREASSRRSAQELRDQHGSSVWHLTLGKDAPVSDGCIEREELRLRVLRSGLLTALFVDESGRYESDDANLLLSVSGYRSGLLTCAHDGKPDGRLVFVACDEDRNLMPQCDAAIVYAELICDGLFERVPKENVLAYEDGHVFPYIDDDDAENASVEDDAAGAPRGTDPEVSDGDEGNLCEVESKKASISATALEARPQESCDDVTATQSPAHEEPSIESEDPESPEEPESPEDPDEEAVVAQENGAYEGLDEARPSYAEEVAAIVGILDGTYGVWNEAEDRDRIGIAVAFAKGMALGDAGETHRQLYLQLLLATDARTDEHRYDRAELGRAFSNWNGAKGLSEVLALCAYCRTMLDPADRFDYNLYSTFDFYADEYDAYFGDYPEIKDLFLELAGIHKASEEHGFTKAVVDRLGTRDESKSFLREISAQASALTNFRKNRAPIPGITEFCEIVFGRESELGKAMAAIAADDRSKLPWVRQVAERFVGEDLSQTKIDPRLLQGAISDTWKEKVFDAGFTKARDLKHYARDQVQGYYEKRIELMCEWVCFHEAQSTGKATKEFSRMRTAIISACNAAEKALYGASGSRCGISLVLQTVDDVRRKLRGDRSEGPRYTDFLRSGTVSLDDDLRPILDDADAGITGFEPWRRVLGHIDERHPSFEDALESASTDLESPTFDNLRQIEHLEHLLGKRRQTERESRRALADAKRSADQVHKVFEETMEIWFTYGRINDMQREELMTIAEDRKDALYAIGDFGIWRALLSALEKQSDRLSANHFSELKQRYEACKEELAEGARSELLQSAHDLLFKERNYSVVEDYLNRFEAGERDRTVRNDDVDEFSRFMSDDLFRPLYELAASVRSSRRLRFVGKQLVDDRHGQDWTSEQIEDAKSLINNWPSNDGHTTTQTRDLLVGLGLKASRCERVPGEGVSREHLRVYLQAEERSLPGYPHPIALFGTQAAPVVDVLVSYENATPDTVIDLVTRSHVSGAAFVLVDYHLDQMSRRRIAERANRFGAGTTFILLDRVLLLHLALTPARERLSVLLKCTLPLTNLQVFNNGAGNTPDEMFVGRVKELESIKGRGGANFVYGGRQLGKSALLERAAAQTNNPKYKMFATVVEIKDADDEQEVVSRACSSLERELKLRKKTHSLKGCDTITDLCARIGSLIDSEDILGLLLMFDEADAFLGSVASRGYEPLKPFSDLQRRYPGKFKYVFAGLHNVARAKKGTEHNGSLGQVGEALCIRPLPPRDALQLLTRPLLYLGFHVAYPHIETILTNTNYYPGLVQYFGNLLVASMPGYYGRYYSAAKGNPPCMLREDQLASIINDNSINAAIREKFMWTLELDEKDRYILIARIVAAMYYELRDAGRPTSEGLHWKSVKEYADSWGFARLSEETDESFRDLMNEMTDMGVFTRSGEHGERYRIRRRTFLGYIGDPDDVYRAFEKELEVEAS